MLFPATDTKSNEVNSVKADLIPIIKLRNFIICAMKSTQGRWPIDRSMLFPKRGSGCVRALLSNFRLGTQVGVTWFL